MRLTTRIPTLLLLSLAVLRPAWGESADATAATATDDPTSVVVNAAKALRNNDLLALLAPTPAEHASLAASWTSGAAGRARGINYQVDTALKALLAADAETQLSEAWAGKVSATSVAEAATAVEEFSHPVTGAQGAGMMFMPPMPFGPPPDFQQGPPPGAQPGTATGPASATASALAAITANIQVVGLGPGFNPGQGGGGFGGGMGRRGGGGNFPRPDPWRMVPGALLDEVLASGVESRQIVAAQAILDALAAWLKQADLTDPAHVTTGTNELIAAAQALGVTTGTELSALDFDTFITRADAALPHVKAALAAAGIDVDATLDSLKVSAEGTDGEARVLDVSCTLLGKPWTFPVKVAKTENAWQVSADSPLPAWLGSRANLMMLVGMFGGGGRQGFGGPGRGRPVNRDQTPGQVAPTPPTKGDNGF